MISLENTAIEIREILKNKREELQLTFFEDTHTYTMLDKGGKLSSHWPSVSKVMKKFYRGFPTDEAAEKKSKGDPIVKQQLIKEWEAAGVYSTNMGSRTHFLLEKKTIELFGGYKDVRQPIFDCDFEQIIKSDAMVRGGHKYLEIMINRGAFLLDTEIVLGHPELGYVGQPDKVWLIMNKEQTEFGLIITDWKTNKKKNFEENMFTDRMYSPFNGQPNTALGHYFIQLPFYGKLLLKMLEGSKYENIKLFGCIVVLLKDDSDYEEFRVPRDVIQTILDMDVKKYIS